jgi:hypothetical protein
MVKGGGVELLNVSWNISESGVKHNKLNQIKSENCSNQLFYLCIETIDMSTSVHLYEYI